MVVRNFLTGVFPDMFLGIEVGTEVSGLRTRIVWFRVIEEGGVHAHRAVWGKKRSPRHMGVDDVREPIPFSMWANHTRSGKGVMNRLSYPFTKTKAEIDEVSALPIRQHPRVSEKDELGLSHFPVPGLRIDVQ